MRYLRQTGKPIILVANKADNFKDDLLAHDFFRLGLGDPVIISALGQRGLDELRANFSQIFQSLKREIASVSPKEVTAPLKFTIVGKQNTGKSTLVNTLAGRRTSNR